MEDAEELPSAAPVLDLLNGFRKSKVLFTLVSLGVCDLLHRNSRHTLSLQQLARLLSQDGAEPSHDGLGRLLDAAVSLQLLGGSRDGFYLTDLAQTYLTRDSPHSLAGYINHSDALLYKLWGDLETAVITGSNCWSCAFGLDSADVFASVYSHEAAVLRFMRGMHGLCQLSAKPVLTAFDLTHYNVLVDLGGATGALAAAACQLHPRMQAVVFDLPSVVAKAEQHFAQAAGVQGVRDRVSWVAGDFFAESQEAALPAGDLYVLSRILHDWEEARCLKLLRLIHSRLPLGGALLLCEMLLDEAGTSPPEVLLQSLNMLAQTHGRERRLSEYSHLLEAAGFRRIRGKKTGSYLDAVIAYKDALGPQAP
ncbi:O-methyltransferase-domain-containing protein [Scenedesmus sp. NREL 46B-D3]|nr:O-methyltransferase-domain-containing protein [Scenedesmus sp. NREL 46B-D3]